MCKVFKNHKAYWDLVVDVLDSFHEDNFLVEFDVHKFRDKFHNIVWLIMQKIRFI